MRGAAFQIKADDFTVTLCVVQRSNSRRTTTEEYLALKEGEEAHWEVVERILFIYAKLNPGLSYVQVSLQSVLCAGDSTVCPL